MVAGMWVLEERLWVGGETGLLGRWGRGNKRYEKGIDNALVGR